MEPIEKTNIRFKLALKKISTAFRTSVQCSFCLKVLSDPVSTLCNHQFCRKCILDFLKRTSGDKCPKCETTIEEKNLKADEFISRICNVVVDLQKRIDAGVCDSSFIKKYSNFCLKKQEAVPVNKDSASILNKADQNDLTVQANTERHECAATTCKTNNGEAILTKLNKECLIKPKEEVVTESRGGFNNKLNNYLVSEDLTGQNDVNGLDNASEIGSAASIHSSADLFLPYNDAQMSSTSKVKNWLNRVSKEPNPKDDVSKEISDDDVANVENDEKEIAVVDKELFEKDVLSEDEYRYNYKSTRELNVANRLNQTKSTNYDCVTATSNLPSDNVEDPFAFIPSQRVMPTKKRGRPKKKPTTNRRGGATKTNVKRTYLPVEKAEAFDDLHSIENSSSDEDDDLYRLFITPKFVESDFKKKEKKRTVVTKREKRKPAVNIDDYENDISVMEKQIEDAEKHELFVTRTKRRKLNNIAEEATATNSNNVKKRPRNTTDVVIDPQEEFNEGDNLKSVEVHPPTAGNKSLVHCSFSPDSLEEDGSPNICDFISNDEMPQQCPEVSGGSGKENSDCKKKLDESFEVVIESVVLKSNNERNIFQELTKNFEKDQSKLCSPEKIVSIEINTPKKTPSAEVNSPAKMACVDENTPTNMATPTKTNASLNTMTPEKIIQSVKKRLLQVRTSNAIVSPCKTDRTISEISNCLEQQYLSHNLSNVQGQEALENTSVCSRCSNVTRVLVSIGVQTDSHFSPTDNVNLDQFKMSEEKVNTSFNHPITQTLQKEVNWEYNSDTESSNKLVIDEDAQSCKLDENKLIKSPVGSIVAGSTQTPPGNSLSFKNYFKTNHTVDDDTEMKIEATKEINTLDIDHILQESKEKVQDEDLTSSIEAVRRLSQITNDAFSADTGSFNGSQTQAVKNELSSLFSDMTKTKRSQEKCENSNSGSKMEVKSKFENLINDSEHFSDEDVFICSGEKSKHNSNETPSTKMDSNSNKLTDNEDNINDDESDHSFLKQSPPKEMKRIKTKSRTRRGLADILDSPGNKIPKLMPLSSSNGKDNLILKEKRKLLGGGSLETNTNKNEEKLNTRRDSVEHLVVETETSQDVIFPTPNSKTGAGRSFTSCSEINESDGKRKSIVDDSGYESVKKAKKCLTSLLEMEVVNQDSLSTSSFHAEEKDVCGLEDHESELEKLRKKHRCFIESDGDDSMIRREVEKKVAVGTPVKETITLTKHTYAVTDSELLNAYDDYAAAVEEQQTSVDYSQRKSPNIIEEITKELMKSQTSIKSELTEQIAPGTIRNRESQSKRFSSLLSSTSSESGHNEKTEYELQLSKRLSERSVREERTLSFIASSLTSQEMNEVQRLAKKIGANFRLKFCDDTTHVIVKTDEELITNRTLKYLQGVASKCWVISYNWVTVSLQVGRLCKEESFEVVGDKVQGDHLGPRRSRMCRDLLLENYEICFYGDFLELTKDNIMELAVTCGAKIVFSPVMFSYKPEMIQLLILQTIGSRRINQIQEICNKYGVIAVVRDWMLDSLSQFKILSMKNYPHLEPSI